MKNQQRLWCCLFLVVFLAVAIASTLVYFLVFGGDPKKLKGFLSPEDFAKEDPFHETQPEDANAWPNTKTGISLNVINSLEDKWHKYFNQAITDWEYGYPQSLDLKTVFANGSAVATHEVTCDAVMGKVKACNGNYGDTHWKGITEVLSDSKKNIVSAAARMNDYYFGTWNEDELQYTMCHELGHAWGLSHTDENFYNKDLGDCMDYTMHPENNKQPTARNFMYLYAMYGRVPGSRPYTPPTSAPSPPQNSRRTPSFAPVVKTKPSPTSKPIAATKPTSLRLLDERALSPEIERTKLITKSLRNSSTPDEKSRPTTTYGNSLTSVANDLLLNNGLSSESASSMEQNFPEWLAHAKDAIMDRDSGRRLQPHRWRVVHLNSKGETHQVDLPHGYRLHVHYLWA